MITARSDHGGGPEHLFQLVKHLSGEFKIFIAAPRDKPYWERYTALVGCGSMIEIPHRRFTVRHLLKLRKFVKSNRIDVIHSHGKGAGIYSRPLKMTTRVKCVHTFHGIHIGQYNAIQRLLYVWLEKTLAAVTNRFIAVSKGEFEKIVNLGITKPRKMSLIENGVEIPLYKVGTDVFNEPRLNILTVSRFVYQKNTELLIPIMQHLAESGKINRFLFHVVGSGETEKHIKKEIQVRGLSTHVVFHGSEDDLSELYKKTFCYLSTSRWEGLPLAVLESMSYGIPTVATEVVGNVDIVEHKITGLLYDITKPKTAAESLVLLSEDRQLWQRMSDKCVDKISRDYSVDRMVEKTEQVYRELLI